jgi:hypothetical protein
MANVLASVAQYETEVRVEWVKAGLAARNEKIARGELVPNKGGGPQGTGPVKVRPTIRQTIHDLAA